MKHLLLTMEEQSELVLAAEHLQELVHYRDKVVVGFDLVEQQRVDQQLVAVHYTDKVVVDNLVLVHRENNPLELVRLLAEDIVLDLDTDIDKAVVDDNQQVELDKVLDLEEVHTLDILADKVVDFEDNQDKHEDMLGAVDKLVVVVVAVEEKEELSASVAQLLVVGVVEMKQEELDYFQLVALHLQMVLQMVDFEMPIEEN